jgi:renalase
VNECRPFRSRIAIIGSGMAGLICAAQLKKHGFRPTIFEKSRGLGGRLATRRLSDGIAFDHGAQYITARSAAFRMMVEARLETGSAHRWRPKRFDDASVAGNWIVGTPAMNALVKPLAEGVGIRFATEVVTVDREDKLWRLRTRADDIGEQFDFVVSSAPAPQASRLFNSERQIADALESVSVAPCWTLMLVFQTSADPGFDVWQSDAEDLIWVSRDSSKPCRSAAKDTWVVHAGPSWSQRHLELGRIQVAEMMIKMLSRTFGSRLPKIESAVSHRWRYARTISTLGKPYLCTEDHTVFVGGDWCLGARVECAFESGQAMASALINAGKEKSCR